MDALLIPCKRVREKNISENTGGFCKARQKLSKELVQRSLDEVIQRLCNHLGERVPLSDRPAYVLDGTALQLDHTPSLEDAYPAACNQQGKSHWPIVRMVVLHDLETGLARQPHWGPMYGAEAVSEQGLAQQAMESLPGKAVIIGDRNFGIFAIACGAQQNGHAVVIRLTAERAQRLHGGSISQPGDYPATWRASRSDQLKAYKLPANASVEGRLIARRVGRGKSKQWLYLFTTMSLGADEVVALYSKRWNIETDLRNLKQITRLQHLQVQSVDMMEKELMVAVMAYNLVRAVMCLAARKTGVHPRQLSFKYASHLINRGIGEVLAAATEVEQMDRFEQLVDLVGRFRIRKRNRKRSYPREIWGRGFRFPKRKAS